MESSKASSIGKLALLFLALFIITVLLAFKASAALLDDLNAFYPMNESSGSIIDFTGNQNGTVVGTPVYQVTGGVGYGILFDGSTDCFYLGTYSPISGTDYTICAWTNLTGAIGASSDFITRKRPAAYYMNGDSGTNKWLHGDGDNVLSNNTITQNQFYYVCGQANSSHHWILINGEMNGIAADTSSYSVAAEHLTIGCNRGASYDSFFTGILDDVGYWNRTLSRAEIDQLYNLGSGLAYPFITNPSTDIDFKATDDFNGSSLNSFNINVSWPNGTITTHSTTNGTVSLINVSDSNLDINITYYNATEYFNLTLLNESITANSTNTITASMYQAVATLTATEKITNNSLSGVTFYIGSKTGTKFNLTAGTHSVTAVKAGYHNLTGSITVPALSNTTYNLEGFYSTIVNFTAYNTITNASVSSFTISTDFGEEVSTTNGTVFINAINNTNYTFNITSPGAFTSRYNLSFVANASTYNVNTSLYTFNSIRFNIFNESSGNLLTQLVTLNVIDSENTTSANTTSTGFISLSLLEPKDYEVRFESSGFNPRSIFLTVTNDSTQNISVYMTENTTTELQVIEVLNTANQPIEGAIVWLQKEQLNSSTRWLTIQEAETDYAGKTSVFVERDVTVFYRFAVIYEGEAKPIEPSGNLFTGKTTFIPGIDETIQLIIDLQEDPEDFISDALAIAVNCSLDNITVSCLIVDGRNSITGAVMRIEASYINQSLNYESIANVSFTGSSGTLEYNLTEVNNSIWRVRTYLTYETSESLVWETIKRFDIDVIIEKNLGLFYAALLLAICFALTVGLGPLPSGLISFAVLIPLTYIKILSLPVGVITGLLALVIIFFFRTRKLDE